MPAFADRLSRVQVAASVQMTIRARELRAQGVDIIQLTIGEPNFDSPTHAIEAAHEAALRGETKYPPQDGTPALKQAIQRKFKRDNGLDFALDEICVTNGGKQAIFNALGATVNPGDEAVIPVPSWSAYALMTKLFDGEPVFVNCPQNNGFKPRAEDIDAAITPKTKWLILNNPNNPTGACCSAKELRAIADVMLKHPHVWIMSDDMYEHLVFDGVQARDDRAGGAGVARSHGDDQRRVEGLRDDRLAHRLCRWPEEPDQGDGQHAGPGDRGRILGRPGCRRCRAGRSAGRRAEQVVAYARRRDMAVEMLNACKGINCHKPEGAFYVFPNVAGCIGKTTAGGRKLENDHDVCMALLEEAHVATVHGAAYGMSPYLRVSTATDDDSLAEGCRRIKVSATGCTNHL